LFVVPHIYVQSTNVFVISTVPNYPAYGMLQPGMKIVAWNNHTITNYSTVISASKSDAPGSIVTITTNTTTYKFTAVQDPNNSSRGLIGVNVGYERQVLNTAYGRFMYFLFTLFSLLFLLNFAVAVVNLLPIPSLDGWRIYKANIKSKKIINSLVIIILVALVINALPLLFYFIK
jgi:membrane-associated protease RseP (regulator of RpoE activity)